MRSCDICQVSDDGPRHVIAGRVGKTPTTRHFVCCAGRGCEVCTEALKEN